MNKNGIKDKVKGDRGRNERVVMNIESKRKRKRKRKREKREIKVVRWRKQ